MEEKKLILTEEELLNTAGGLTPQELEELRAQLLSGGFVLGGSMPVFLPAAQMETTAAGFVLLTESGQRVTVPASAATIALASGKMVVVMKASDMSKDLADELGLTR